MNAVLGYIGILADFVAVGLNDVFDKRVYFEVVRLLSLFA